MPWTCSAHKLYLNAFRYEFSYFLYWLCANGYLVHYTDEYILYCRKRRGNLFWMYCVSMFASKVIKDTHCYITSKKWKNWIYFMWFTGINFTRKSRYFIDVNITCSDRHDEADIADISQFFMYMDDAQLHNNMSFCCN